MGTSAEVYRDAAHEHVIVAAELYASARYVMAHYVAGLSVECILRAYQVRRNAEFDAKHDLQKLSYSAKFPELFPKARFNEYQGLLAAVVVRWKNDFRYRSLKSLRSYLIRLHVHEGIKGDVVKESARRIVNAATTLVELGVTKWKP